MGAAANNEEMVFNTARELTSPDERSAYLERVCGKDSAFLTRMEALLEAHEVKDNFLETPAIKWGETVKPVPHQEKPGDTIGRYHLLEKIGEGGMGTVYLAEQKEPIRRRVALKVIKPGMDSVQVLARFEAERQVLALMDHVSIAQVHDAGATEKGRPYFVMEYVEGVSITEHCDRHKLSIEQRLMLFGQVCEALQHAHQKGIIHRDIKSSNIIVVMDGDKAIPKVIDFGVAKAINQPLTERSLFTEQGQLIGTPEYMSPEQADMDMQNIDTRSDIYSLGVLLYELLTGVLPFDRELLRQAAFTEIQRIIREENPPSCSFRLSRLGDEAEVVAQKRHTELSVLTRRLHRELEWIPLKAMRKERGERYQSALELAQDINNYLDGAPLIAGPESTSYLVKKFVRRNRTLVSAAAVVVVVLTAGVVTSTIFAIGQARARSEANRQRAEAVTQRDRAIEAEGLAEERLADALVARDEAERNARIAQAVNDFLNNDLLTAVQPLGHKVTVREALDAAATKIEGKFAGEPVVEASIRFSLAGAYSSLGEHKAAEPHILRAIELRKVTLGAEDDETLRTMEAAATIYHHLARHDLELVLKQEILETIERTQGETEAPDAMISLGVTYGELNRNDEAEALLAGALEIRRRRLGDQNKLTLDAMVYLADHYMKLEQYDKAEPLFAEAVEVSKRVNGEVDEVTVFYMNRLARVYLRLARYDQAEPMYLKALEQNRRLVGEEHPSTQSILNDLAGLYFFKQDFEKAQEVLVEIVNYQTKKLGTEHSSTLRAMDNLILVYQNLQDYEKMKPLLVQVRQSRLKALGEDHPSTLDTLNKLAWLQATSPVDELRDGAEAVKNATRACELTEYQNHSYLETLAAAYGEAGDFANAVKWQQQALEIMPQDQTAEARKVSENRLSLYQSGKSYRQEKR